MDGWIIFLLPKKKDVKKTKLNTEISNFSGVDTNKQYVITEVKQTKVTDRQNKDVKYDAILVIMKSTEETDETIYTESLWLSDQATPNSKLGSFLVAFENFFDGKQDYTETNNWLNHTVVVRDWRPKKREIEVLN